MDRRRGGDGQGAELTILLLPPETPLQVWLQVLPRQFEMAPPGEGHPRQKHLV